MRTDIKNLTEGNIGLNLLKLSLPMLFANVLNLAYSIVDTLWIGNIVGPVGLGASAVSFPIIFVAIAISGGVTMATSILVGQYFGAKNYKMLDRVVAVSSSLGIIVSILLSILGIILSKQILIFMNTPKDILEMASEYLQISLTGFVFIYYFFLIAAILRGIGDTMRPLIFLVIAAVLNVILDPLLIIGIAPFPEMGLKGAAVATVISQAVAVLFGLIYLEKKDSIVKMNPFKFEFDKKIASLIIKIGVPNSVQQLLVSVSAIFVTSFVNAYGNSATAAFGITQRIDQVAVIPAQTMMMAISTMVAQSIGAKKLQNVRLIFNAGFKITLSITLIISGSIYLFSPIILKIFTQNEEVIDIGVGYLSIMTFGYVLWSLMFVSVGVMNGAGKTSVNAVLTIFSLWIVRVPLGKYLPSLLINGSPLGIIGIWYGGAISSIFGITFCTLYYYSGAWKKGSRLVGRSIEEDTIHVSS